MLRSWRSVVLALVTVLGVLAADGRVLAQAPSGSAVKQDAVVAGGPQDFMEVRHVVLKGSNEAIGKALADIARERHQATPATGGEPLRTRARRHYIEKNYPILFDRMRGVAAVFGKRLDDDSCDLSGLDYGLFSAGCSVVHFPPSTTADGTSIVSRDYDFTTGTMRGLRPKKGEQPCTSRPYVIEMYPDHGYASLAVYSYDLLSGALDGINSEGLTVALLADDELSEKFAMEPAGPGAVGLGALQTVRMLLDTCATTEEAKEALLQTKQYYEFVQVHYLVADRNGKSFIWEYSQAHNREYIVDNPGKPLVTTNFSLHRHMDDGKLPTVKSAEKVCPRYCILTDKLCNRDGKLTVDYIKETHKLVDAARPAPKNSPRAPGRTLWHALYFPEQRRMQINFYLKDEPDPNDPKTVHIVRSEYLDFKLEGPKAEH
jgi:hypothetical protein